MNSAAHYSAAQDMLALTVLAAAKQEIPDTPLISDIQRHTFPVL